MFIKVRRQLINNNNLIMDWSELELWSQFTVLPWRHPEQFMVPVLGCQRWKKSDFQPQQELLESQMWSKVKRSSERGGKARRTPQRRAHKSWSSCHGSNMVFLLNNKHFPGQLKSIRSIFFPAHVQRADPLFPVLLSSMIYSDFSRLPRTLKRHTYVFLKRISC